MLASPTMAASAMDHPFFEDLVPTLNVAHRGGLALAPENTLAAFELAVGKHRCPVVETDLHRTKDGELVLCHDATVNRTTNGKGALDEMTWSEVSALDAGHHFTPDGDETFPFRDQGVRIPRLADAFEALPEARWNIDVKPDDPAVAEEFGRVVRAAKAESRICCGSEFDAVGEALVNALPGAAHIYPREALILLVGAILQEEEPDRSVPYLVAEPPLEFEGTRIVTPQFIRATKRIGRWTMVWTVNEVAEMRPLVDAGVGGIITDRPDLLRGVLVTRR